MKHTFKAIIITAICALFSTNGIAQIDHWEKLVGANDTWQYRVGNSEPSSSWMNASFSASSWSSGTGGIGYGDATKVHPRAPRLDFEETCEIL